MRQPTVRTLTVLIVVCSLTSACRKQETNTPHPETPSSERPYWPHGLRDEGTLCNVLITSDYVVRAKPLKIELPVKLELSPWPGEPFWATPVQWEIVSTLITRSVSGQALPALARTIRTITNAPFADLTSERYFGLTEVDGRYLMDVSASFYQKDGRLVWESGSLAFVTKTALEQAINTELGKSSCNRVDVLGLTRIANVERLKAVPTPDIPVVHSTGP